MLSFIFAIMYASVFAFLHNFEKFSIISHNLHNIQTNPVTMFFEKKQIYVEFMLKRQFLYMFSVLKIFLLVE